MLLIQDRMRQQSRFCMATKLSQVMRSILNQVPLLESLCHLHRGFETPAGCFRFNFVVLHSQWSSLCSQSLMLCTHKGQGIKSSIRFLCFSFVQTIRKGLAPLCWKLRKFFAIQKFFSLFDKLSLALYICVRNHEFPLISTFAHSITSLIKRSGCFPLYLSVQCSSRKQWQLFMH